LSAEWSSSNPLGPENYSAGSNKKVLWVCAKNHQYSCSVNNRTNGAGCPYCAGKKPYLGETDLATIRPDLLSEWDFSKNKKKPGDYTSGADQKVWWICQEGHSWMAKVRDRTRTDRPGSGCPKCAFVLSRGEADLLKFVQNLLPGEEILHGDRTTISPYELDIYVPSKRLAIEFNGIYWHSEFKNPLKSRHHDKYKKCLDEGIRLITIWEDQWRESPDLIKKMISRKLGVSVETKVFARNTFVSSISKEQAKLFLDENHIQGFVSGTYYLGLFHKNDLVAVCVLKKFRDDLTLSRYATDRLVPGGHSKMISWIQKNLDFDRLVTFADLCVSDGSLYETTGWRRDAELAPDYRYVVGSRREHKFNYRLKRFRDDPNLLFEEGMTEKQLAELNGIPRIWDCGKIRYVMEKIK